MPDLPWFVYAMLLAPLGLILGAAAYKTLQARAAREWPSTAGKVAVSNAEVRNVKVMDSDREDGHRFEERNFANIVYEYSVAGRKLRNNRVSIGEDRGNFEVAETVARYPVGAVVTVYYNPLHPNEAVLERDLPKGMWGCLGIGTAIVLAIVFGSAIGLHQISEFVSQRLVDPKLSPLVVGLGAFGVVSGAVRARRAAASIAGAEMAGRVGHHQAVGNRGVPCSADRAGNARAGHVSAEGVLQLHLEQDFLYQHARQPREQRRRRPRAGWCASPRRLIRTAPPSRFASIRPIHRKQRSNRAPASSGCCGSSSPPSLQVRITLAVHG